MARRRRLSPEELTRTLRDWDPACGDTPLTAEEQRHIERALTVPQFSQKPFRQPRRSPRFALAGAGGLALAVLILFVAWGSHLTERTPQAGWPPSGRGAAASSVSPGPRRSTEPSPGTGRPVQVQLIARGGTRIVWILNPQLPALPDSFEENSDAR